MEPHELHDHSIYLLRGWRYEARHIACRANNGKGYARLHPLDDADDILHLEYGWQRLLRVVQCGDHPDGIDYRTTHLFVSELRHVGIDPRSP